MSTNQHPIAIPIGRLGRDLGQSRRLRNRSDSEWDDKGCLVGLCDDEQRGGEPRSHCGAASGDLHEGISCSTRLLPHFCVRSSMKSARTFRRGRTSPRKSWKRQRVERSRPKASGTSAAALFLLRRPCGAEGEARPSGHDVEDPGELPGRIRRDGRHQARYGYPCDQWPGLGRPDQRLPCRTFEFSRKAWSLAKAADGRCAPYSTSWKRQPASISR